MPETKPCPHCRNQINIRYSTCPFCGGESREDVSARPPTCPRCNTALDILKENGDEYDLCPRCGGLWLDRIEFTRATRESAVFREADPKEGFLKKPDQNPVAYIPCVRCGKMMNRKNFARISGVIVDECGTHGIWLDGGEMERIRRFIADGGLDKSRDREIEKNRENIRALASQVDHIAFTQRLIHFWNPKRWFFGP
jgi:Zn-finger nucleic acid-binding protein